MRPRGFPIVAPPFGLPAASVRTTDPAHQALPLPNKITGVSHDPVGNFTFFAQGHAGESLPTARTDRVLGTPPASGPKLPAGSTTAQDFPRDSLPSIRSTVAI